MRSEEIEPPDFTPVHLPFRRSESESCTNMMAQRTDRSGCLPVQLSREAQQETRKTTSTQATLARQDWVMVC